MVDDPDSKAPESGGERRGLTRLFTCYPFRMQKGEMGESSDAEIAVIQDLGPGGAYMLMTSELGVGTRVKLHLDFSGPLVRMVEGRVLRTERRPDDKADVWPFGAAVQFDEVHEDLLPHIEELARLVGDSG